MADGLRKPEPLCFEGNVALNLKHFAQEVEMFIAAAHGEKDDRTKAYIILNLAGREAIEKEKSCLRSHCTERRLNRSSQSRISREYRSAEKKIC